MSPKNAPEHARKPEQYASGRERIEAAQAARNAAQTLHELEAELPTTAEVAPAASGLIDGVRIIWINQHRTARDETAFRHALATAHRLKAQGQPLKDAKIIDAYERAYNIAQAVGADYRQPDIPPMRDRLTMARRVRGYVTRGITNPNTTGKTSPKQSNSGRKALATMGRRGGQQAAKRWNSPAHKEYQEAARKPLTEANQRRAVGAKGTKFEIAAFFQKHFFETGKYPLIADATAEFGVSEKTIRRALKDANIVLPRGRKPSQK